MVGTWVIESIDFDPDPIIALKATGKPDDQIAYMTKMLDELKNGFIKHTKINYKADGTFDGTTFNVATGGAKEESGTWKISEDGKSMTTVDSKGKEDTVPMEFVSDSKVKVIDDRSKQMTVIMNFVKQ